MAVAAAPSKLLLSAAQAYHLLAGAAAAMLASLPDSLQASIPVTKQQLRDLLKQPDTATATAAAQASGCNSLLLVNWYPPQQATAEPAAAAASGNSTGSWSELRGVEAHVDRGLLTLVVDTQPGLQVKRGVCTRCLLCCCHPATLTVCVCIEASLLLWLPLPVLLRCWLVMAAGSLPVVVRGSVQCWWAMH